MKALFPALLLASLASTTPAVAVSANSSPLLGTWAVDVSSLPMPPAERPKSVTISFSEAAGGKWATRVDIVDADGARRHAASTYALDGTPSPVEGEVDADIGAVKMPAPNVLVLTLGKGGAGSSTRVYTVAPDGNSQVEIATYYTRDGAPVLRTAHFNRVR